MKTLTLETLIAKGACAASQEKFATLFPNGAPLTVETFVNVAHEFDWECAAKLLLTSQNQVLFKQSIADYTDALATALAAAAADYDSASDAYVTACVAVLATYADRDAAYATAFDASAVARAALAIAYATYAASAASASALATARSTAFATLYIKQESHTS